MHKMLNILLFPVNSSASVDDSDKAQVEKLIAKVDAFHKGSHDGQEISSYQTGDLLCCLMEKLDP